VNTNNNEECKALAIRDCDRQRFALRERIWAIRADHFYGGRDDARNVATATIAGSLDPATTSSDVLISGLLMMFATDPLVRARNSGRLQGWLAKRMAAKFAESDFMRGMTIVDRARAERAKREKE
jgi:hypothetical protein